MDSRSPLGPQVGPRGPAASMLAQPFVCRWLWGAFAAPGARASSYGRAPGLFGRLLRLRRAALGRVPQTCTNTVVHAPRTVRTGTSARTRTRAARAAGPDQTDTRYANYSRDPRRAAARELRAAGSGVQETASISGVQRAARQEAVPGCGVIPRYALPATLCRVCRCAGKRSPHQPPEPLSDRRGGVRSPSPLFLKRFHCAGGPSAAR